MTCSFPLEPARGYWGMPSPPYAGERVGVRGQGNARASSKPYLPTS